MAKKSMIAKSKREPKFSTRQHNRCARCGRPRAYYRKFGLCRVCLRELNVTLLSVESQGACAKGAGEPAFRLIMNKGETQQ